MTDFLDPSQIAWLLSLVPDHYKYAFGAVLILGSFLLNLASYLRKKIQPPAAGSRWTKPYAILTKLANAKGWAAPMYDTGQTAIKTTRASAPELKAAAMEKGIPLLGADGKPKPPAAS